MELLNASDFPVVTIENYEQALDTLADFTPTLN